MSNLDEIILELINLLKQKEYLKVQKKAILYQLYQTTFLICKRLLLILRLHHLHQ